MGLVMAGAFYDIPRQFRRCKIVTWIKFIILQTSIP